MKTFYHGTIAGAVPSILQHGLTSNPDRKWKARLGSRRGPTVRSMEEKLNQPINAIYVSKTRKLAKVFADTRAAYLNAQPGTFAYGKGTTPLWKMYGAPVDPNAKPAIVKK